MTLRVVGAGLGRTGTHSLKLALEQLLGDRCYHMIEVFAQPEHVPRWQSAANGEMPDWDALLAGYVAIVDWPGASFWKELSAANPDALVLLSVRKSPEAWWRSANATIFEVMGAVAVNPEMAPWDCMVRDMLSRRFTERWADPEAAMAAYERHNAEVRSTIAGDRLLEWRPGDGWAPICAALDLPVPDQPFPHVNTTSEFRAMTGLDGSPPPSDAAPAP